MSPSIVELPARAGSLKFATDDVVATIELLTQCTPGQAVKLTDEPDAKENTSRRRAEIMKEQVEEMLEGDPIKPGYKIRGHVLTAGEPDIKKTGGKNYKFFPENWGAVSLVPDNDPETPAPDPAPDGAADPEGGENTAPDPPAGTADPANPPAPDSDPPAPDAPDATVGKGKGKGK